jgi:nitroreductase
MKAFLSSLFIVFGVMVMQGQDLKPIKLPNPKKEGGKPLFTALNERHSAREFDSVKTLDQQTLSNLLWCAFGYNRIEDGKRTAPSSMNCQEIDIYVVDKNGIFVWDAKANVLNPVAKGDFRDNCGKQPFVKNAALNLVYVANRTKMKGSAEEQIVTAGTNTGFIGQNVYLFCASEGLSTVIRGYFDANVLSPILKLNKDQFITLSQTVGYPLK